MLLPSARRGLGHMTSELGEIIVTQLPQPRTDYPNKSI